MTIRIASLGVLRRLVGRGSRIAWSLILLGALQLTPRAQAAEHPGLDIKPVAGNSKAVTLNLNNADIQAFISAVADLTGKNFVIDPRVKGQVTVVSSAPTEPEALYEVFLSVLKVNGFAAVPSGNVIKIVPDLNARQEGSGDVVTGAARRSEQIVTAVIPTVYVNAAELVPVLRPLLPQEAHLAATARADALVVADTGANVNRIMRIVRDLDRDNANDIEVVPLKNAEAIPLVATLQQLLAASAAGQPGQQPPIAADERSNSVLIGGPPGLKLRLRNLIHELDKPGSKIAETIEVIYLRFASAKDLVPVLQAIGDRAQHPSSGGKGRGAAAPVLIPNAGGSGEIFQVQADEATNSVIIQAPPELLVELKQVITKLDIRRAQVLVEGIVAEVSNNKADELGVQWRTNAPSNGAFAGTLLPGVAAGPITNPFDTKSVPGFLQGLSLGYFTGGDLRTLLRALSSDQFTNVLSTPTLMTLDNAKAEIVVGQNVPFVTGQYTNPTSGPNTPFQTIERKDVGVLLKVTPQINAGDTLKLKLEQEVSSVNAATSGTNLVTNKRQIKTTVLVDDKQIIVLGGLISNELHQNKSKIPLLGDIPVLGHLFSNTNSDYTKTNLMVFLRPTIIRDQATNRALTGARYDDIHKKQQQQEGETQFFLRDKGPALPNDGLVE
ncbi:MAG: type II secretion system secretin GspD [Gammaproteobacteria bacterium]|nr:type II secretion system secretin GspD [Gammaproteobacteria bacterium]